MHQRREKKMPKEVLAGAVLDLHQAETRLGIVKAVTEAIALDAGDHWVLYLPRIKKPGRMGFGRRALSTETEAALSSRTHDQLDAARMRLCLDESDDIRRFYLEGQ
jgi:hypothetical protein